MYQKWIGIGRLTKDPELRETSDGTPVARFTLAVDRSKDEADFIDIIVWREQAENCVKYLKKGAPAAVEGRLQIRTYEDSQGIRRKAAEIVASRVVFLPNGKKSIEEPPWPDEAPPASRKGKEDKDDFIEEVNFDDIPF
ncbi:single-strand binding protein [Desulfofundulus australicus DSM 11792]|uniref:Single-stranded DNA-binding protein n=1 Tax=Desulfofundulus australicus DSM 11792 TaxID=1121425 RepID=A0A1M4XQZ2_9FIRM|nr:single-stranded DNA-binding protein [Desulfofundulus australicus]SHE95868.1 single-strand binding protein [Desulfofundulus australicus DSM 11792]